MRNEMKLGTPVFTDSRTTQEISQKSIRKRLLSPFLCSILAAIGIFGGISALFAGLICVVIHSIASADTVFDRAGTVLLVLSIPAILIGSIFLDEVPAKQRQR